jgi:hypothetical protein
MASIYRTGFEQTANALWVAKDVEAQLKYTFDWSQWLEGNDTVASVAYTVAARRNDPTPVVIEDSGIVNDVKTYVELSGGQLDKVYIVTCKVTTTAGVVDRRSFKLQVAARSA